MKKGYQKMPMRKPLGCFIFRRGFFGSPPYETIKDLRRREVRHEIILSDYL